MEEVVPKMAGQRGSNAGQSKDSGPERLKFGAIQKEIS